MRNFLLGLAVGLTLAAGSVYAADVYRLASGQLIYDDSSQDTEIKEQLNRIEVNQFMEEAGRDQTLMRQDPCR